MESAKHQYGYLAIERVHGGLLTLPDGEQLFEEYAKADDALHKWVTEDLLPKAVEQAQQKRKAFVDGCTWDERKVKQPGLLTADLVVREVLDPDGAVIGNPDVADFAEIVEKEALERFPEPNVRGVANQSDGKVKQVVVWKVALYVDGQHKSLPAFSTWSFGLPIKGVLEVLDELAEDGWSVAHVSEDRGLYKGLTNQTDSAVTTARYLLVRNS